MRKVFIDAGAHDGCSVRCFRKEFDKNIEYDIYSFEIEPNFKKKFDNIPRLTFINKAVWTEDGAKEFYRSKTYKKYSGSLIKSKKTGMLDKDNPIIVDTIDLSGWVKDMFSEDDFIILKMDIEGAEYDVLFKMIEEGSFDYINELWIEWHCDKIDVLKETHDKLLKLISIPIVKWNATKYSEK